MQKTVKKSENHGHCDMRISELDKPNRLTILDFLRKSRKWVGARVGANRALFHNTCWQIEGLRQAPEKKGAMYLPEQTISLAVELSSFQSPEVSDSSQCLNRGTPY
jgi:hypothetical protein